MLIDYLSSKFKQTLDEGWGAFEVGNFKKSEEHFRDVLKRQDDPHATYLDSIEAHVGMGAVSFAHRDFFDATRWYREAHHLLDEFYEYTWPDTLSWAHPHDRPAMRTLIGLGHLFYHKGDVRRAREYYERLRGSDKKDELGVAAYLAGLEKKLSFDECASVAASV